jgi:hypothetical protein
VDRGQGLEIRESGLRPALLANGMELTDEDLPTRFQHARGFSADRCHVLDVLENECAHDDVDRAITKWPAGLDVMLNELAVGGSYALARSGEHASR